MISSGVETGVEHFIVVPSERFDALTTGHVPQPCRPINTPRQHVVTREVELAAGEFGRVAILLLARLNFDTPERLDALC